MVSWWWLVVVGWVCGWVGFIGAAVISTGSRADECAECRKRMEE